MNAKQLLDLVRVADTIPQDDKERLTSWLVAGPSVEQAAEIRQALLREYLFQEERLTKRDQAASARLQSAKKQQVSLQSQAAPLTMGVPIPPEGLDPRKLFASPPPGPTSRNRPPSPAGSGPSPPSPGQQVSQTDGFDDEDLRILALVGDYRFGSLADQANRGAVVLPDHPNTQFDEVEFLDCLRGSISHTRDEKLRIIAAIPKLSQVQINELVGILDEERAKFSQLSPKHLHQLRMLEQLHVLQWQTIVDHYNAPASERRAVALAQVPQWLL